MNVSSVGQRSQVGGSTMKTSSICPLPQCTAKSYSNREFLCHLKKSHGFVNDDAKFKSILAFYAADYFTFDSKIADNFKFAHVCKICAKKSGDRKSSDPPSTSFEQNEKHVIEHIGTMQFWCSLCDSWFRTSTPATKHSTRCHDGNTILPINKYFGENTNAALEWTRLSDKLFVQFRESMILNDQSHCVQDAELDTEVTEFVRGIDILSPDCHSLRDFAGSMSRVLEVAGNWEKIGKLIYVSPPQEIADTFEEISTELGNFLFHKSASIALAALLYKANDYWWNVFVTMLKEHSFRCKMYRSEFAAQFVRKVLSGKDLPSVKFESFSSAFVVNGKFDDELNTSNVRSLFYAGFASHTSTAAEVLCELASGQILHMATNNKLNESIRRLIKTANFAKNQCHSEYYENFLSAVCSALPQLMRNYDGLFVVQAIFYQPTQSVFDHIKLVMTTEWIFDTFIDPVSKKQMYHYDNPKHCHLIQTAINASPPDDCCDLAWELKGKSDGFKRLLFSKVGNNIIRRLTQMISDLDTLEMITSTLKLLLKQSGIQISRHNAYIKLSIDIACERHDFALAASTALDLKDSIN